MSEPLVSAIILNYRSGREAWKCAESLLRQELPSPTAVGEGSGVRVEVLVIDNHSDDDSIGFLRARAQAEPRACPERAQASRRVKILETRGNIGFGGGYNLGFRHARGKYFLVNNPSKILRPDAVEKMVEAMENDSSIGILGPKLTYGDGTIRDSYRSFPSLSDVFIKRTMLRHLFRSHMRRYLQWDRDPEVTGETDWVIGGCMMIRSDLCRQLHGFDERFSLFFEDIDLCRRCSHAGKKVVYFPAASGTDRKKRLSEGGLLTLFTNKTARQHLVSALKYFWKWRGVPLMGH